MLRLRSRLRGGNGRANTPYTPPAGISGVAADFDFTNNGSISQVVGSLAEIRSLVGSHTLYQNDGAYMPAIGTRLVSGEQVADFDGSDDYLICSSSLLPYINGDCTVVVVGASDTKQNTFFAFFNDATLGSPNLQYDFGGDVFRVDHGNGQSSAAITFNTNKHFMALSKSGSSVFGYYDGAASGTATITTPAATIIDGFIGKGPSFSTARLDGYVKRIIIYNRGLNTTELSNLMAVI